MLSISLSKQIRNYLLLITGLLSAVSSVYAFPESNTWYHVPPSTLFIPANIDTTKISIINGFSWNLENTSTAAQWSDIFFPNTPTGWSNEMISQATCVYIHYHGGGWTGNDPRDTINPFGNYYEEQQKPEILSVLVDKFAAPVNRGGFGCIMITMSYPLAKYDAATGNLLKMTDGPSGVINQKINVSKIIGSIFLQGSVYWTFNKFYWNQFVKWKAINPNLQLYVGGVSAGAYLAQRIATAGTWPINGSLLMSPPILNPKAFDDTVISRLDNSNPIIGRRCTTAFGGPMNINNYGKIMCNLFSQLYGATNGSGNQNDLHNYSENNLLAMTYVISNICDNISDTGSIVKGWFNSIAPDKRQIYIHTGFNDMPETTGSGHGHFGKMYRDFFISGGPGLPLGSQWLANGAATYSPQTIGENSPQYASNCFDPVTFIRNSIQN